MRAGESIENIAESCANGTAGNILDKIKFGVCIDFMIDASIIFSHTRDCDRGIVGFLVLMQYLARGMKGKAFKVIYCRIAGVNRLDSSARVMMLPAIFPDAGNLPVNQ